MERRFWVIDSSTERKTASDEVNKLICDGTASVAIYATAFKRTLAQNALMWHWIGEEGKATGEFKMDTYRKFKFRHCVPVLLKEDQEDDGYFSLLYKGVMAMEFPTPDDRKGALKEFIDMIHTSDMSIAEMHSALTEYELWMGVKGIPFRHPVDLYNNAMGRQTGAKK